ncbi:hypothetical protein ACTRXD_17155 [Nitrospira sp. T9]|uniref:hypothetical protein n=1 Tax=unclassified Nitrospira TaxID=2652172 RepID=UPI003F964350
MILRSEELFVRLDTRIMVRLKKSELTGQRYGWGEVEGEERTSLVKGSVEKSRQRRSRHFSVLTYWKYALRAKMTAAFPSRGLRTGLDGPFGKTQGILF